MVAAVGAMRGISDRARDATTVVLGLWLMAGLFLDGYMHTTRAGQLESFLTPWHGVLYSGYLASALWICWPLLQGGGGLRERVTRLPVGYGLGALGVVVFGVGGNADALWHSLLGIEADIEALLSPAHLVLLAGAILILTTPLRAAWHRPGRDPGLAELLPAVLSLTLATLLVGFFLMYASGLYDFHATTGFVEVQATRFPDSPFLYEVLTGLGIVARLLTTALLLGPVVLLIRRWHPPVGTFTVLFGTYAAFMLVLDELAQPEMVLAGLAAGVTADVLAQRWRPAPDRPLQVHLLAVTVPMVLWLSHFGLLAARGDLGWPFVIWGGVVVLAGGTGLSLSLLALPPRAPAT